MLFDSDVALLGTGLAPLVAAKQFLAQGKSITLLNPDWDFFLEDSEMPFDPFVPEIPRPDRIAKSQPDRQLEILRPEFPGALEFWAPEHQSLGFHDVSAPHVRQRGRLWIWIRSFEREKIRSWEKLENLYVEASDSGLNPQLLEDLPAARRFPGTLSTNSKVSAIFIPKLSDVDSIRYRNGLLEFVRERVNIKRFFSTVSQIEWIPGGIRFLSQGVPNTTTLRNGMLVFWTPRLSSWVLSQAKRRAVTPRFPRGVRLWEQWIFDTNQSLDPNTIGIYQDMAVWAHIEGMPKLNEKLNKKLAILKAGPLMQLERAPSAPLTWAGSESFTAISNVCHDLLGWDRLSIASMKPRTLFEWDHDHEEISWILSHENPMVRVVSGCDGPIAQIVRNTRLACSQLLAET